MGEILNMSRWRVDYRMEGSVEVEADTLEDVSEAFYELDEQEIIDNCYFGNQIEDITLID